MEKKKYNLRSFKSDGVQAPIQMHLSEDHDFLTNLLGNLHMLSKIQIQIHRVAIWMAVLW